MRKQREFQKLKEQTPKNQRRNPYIPWQHCREPFCRVDKFKKGGAMRVAMDGMAWFQQSLQTRKGRYLIRPTNALEFETLTTLAAMSCVWCSFRQTSQGRYLYNHSAETSRWYAAMSCVWFSLGQTLTCGKNQVACWYRNGEPVSSTCFSEKEPGSCDYWRQKHGTRSSFTEV